MSLIQQRTESRYRGVPLAVRRAVFDRADGVCEGIVRRFMEDGVYSVERVGVCGSPAVDVAHIQPKGLGGSRLLDYPGNLLALCRDCHNRMDGR
jgi:5-methylcytosine-specific restriction endonuclease McrA